MKKELLFDLRVDEIKPIVQIYRDHFIKYVVPVLLRVLAINHLLLVENEGT